MKKRKQFRRLAWREYLPLAATAAMWFVIVIAIGAADAARLLAAVTFVRGIQLLTKCATPLSVKRRMKSSAEIRDSARRLAFNVQATALIVGLLLVSLLVDALRAAQQVEIAAYLPFIALGMPARYLRLSDVRAASPFYRLALAGGGAFMAALAWAGGWVVPLVGLIFGAREWIAYFALRLWPRTTVPSRVLRNDPLRFPEIASNSAIYGRRMLTYRLSKVALALLGPLGNAAARTGRGLNWHRKVEPYLPHHLAGFILFTAGAWGGAIFTAIKSDEPAAMVLAAGLFQIGSAAANVLLFWYWLPSRESSADLEDDDDED